MNWLEITIITKTEAIEVLCSLLTACGAAGFEIQDGAQLADFIEHETANWDYLNDDVLAHLQDQPCVKFFLADNQQGREQLAAVQVLLAQLTAEAADFYGSLALSQRAASDSDWEDNWKRYYQPVKINSRLTVVPSWQSYQAAAGEVVVALDPGMAFGTGDHPTTMLALRLLADYLQVGDRVLDVGTGSGVLAITAAKLGAQQVLATDYDQLSVQIAAENVQKNGVGAQVVVQQHDLVAGVSGQYQVVVANIVADIILRLIPDVAALLAPRGVFIFSGIIEPRFGEILAALRQAGWQPLVKVTQGDWLAMAVRQAK